MADFGDTDPLLEHNDDDDDADDDDDDDERSEAGADEGDTTTPFQPDENSTPGPSGEENRMTTMNREQEKGSKTAETSFIEEREVLIAQKYKEIEKLQQSIQDDRDISDDENENPAVRERAREKIAENQEQIDDLENERERQEERL
ncbi:RNA polymerase-associated protein LEO1-like [Stylophora pistillata]|uniref:RNA polymerase-associated protein LEO1-like n=1 Tax=Stylophora pistillata TaxID=50429 RepID=UPI000C041F5C|nr:RNA polymerase-associated protein LEO1-like [Stylophora pistillata]